MTEAGKLFGERLRELRKKRGLMQVQLSEMTAVPQAHIRHIERGSKLPTLGMMIRARGRARVQSQRVGDPPTNAIHRINSPGSTLQTINASSWCPLGCTIVRVPLSTFSVGTAGNIGRAMTAVVGQPLAMTYAGGTWYPSY